MFHLGVMLGWCLPIQVGKSHILRQNWGEGIQNSSYYTCHLVPTALLSPHGLSLFWVGLCHLRWQLLLVMAAGRKGQDTCLFGLLWKEPMALKVCLGFPEPELWSWAPTHGPC